MDETYRKAGKMDSGCVCSTLDLSHTDLMSIIRGHLEGTQSTNKIKTELYKLNVFPSPHEGGALLLRHCDQEWTFDSGKALAVAKDKPSNGYVAFFVALDLSLRVLPSQSISFPQYYQIRLASATPSRHYLRTQNSWQTAAHLGSGCGTSIRSRMTSITSTRF